MQDVLEAIRQCFPRALVATEYFDQVNRSLTKQHKFTPGNTRFAEGACCDEINEPELQHLERYWGERFKFGGLAGYCHGGRTSLAAVSRHVPEEDGKRNLLLVGGPHIGWHGGEWGKVPRVGQVEISTSCGALMAIVDEGFAGLHAKTLDPLDSQQFFVERIMLPFLKETDDSADVPLIARATQFLMRRIDTDLRIIVDDMLLHFDGQIACITGVTINTTAGNFLCPSTQVVLNQQGTGKTVTLV